jgi:hypothetical protein
LALSYQLRALSRSGGEAAHPTGRENDRIIGRAHRYRRGGVAGVGRAHEEDPGGDQIAGTASKTAKKRAPLLAACRTEVYSMIANGIFVGANVHRTRDRAQSALLRSPIELASRCLGCF